MQLQVSDWGNGYYMQLHMPNCLIFLQFMGDSSEYAVAAVERSRKVSRIFSCSSGILTKYFSYISGGW